MGCGYFVPKMKPIGSNFGSTKIGLNVPIKNRLAKSQLYQPLINPLKLQKIFPTSHLREMIEWLSKRKNECRWRTARSNTTKRSCLRHIIINNTRWRVKKDVLTSLRTSWTLSKGVRRCTTWSIQLSVCVGRFGKRLRSDFSKITSLLRDFKRELLLFHIQWK